MYMKLRKALVEKKDVYFPNDTKDKKQRIENIANTLYTLASNRPKEYGTMKKVANEELDELIAVYEQDLLDHIQLLDANHLCRMA